MTRTTEPDVEIGWYTGDRRTLRPLFELAEDSATELDGYLDLGRVLLARLDGEAVGHLQLVAAEPGTGAELKNMAVREDQQGRGIGRRLVRAARALLTAEGAATLTVATATADIGNLRFYQRQGFRMLRVDRDAFTAATGYPAHTDVDGIPLRDRVWLDLPLTPEEPHPVNAHRGSLFCDTDLAARIERAETELIVAVAEAGRHRGPDGAAFAIPIAGGAAVFAEDGSPMNKVVGLGFGGPPSPAALDEVERAYAERGAPTQVELAHVVDPDIAAMLTDRGYRLESFEDVLGRALDRLPEPDPGPGIEIRRSGDDEFDRWLAVMADAVAHPDTQGVPWREEFPREVYERAERDGAAAGVERYIALRDGAVAGGAGLRRSAGIAQFAGAATAPAHRRHGIQSALLAVRLADAAAAGCDVAVITTQPGSRSGQNAHRQGFELLYTRAVLVKPAS
jgi:GNAT superfamily N-acetyltransferase